MNGFIPIIAHAERYKATRSDIRFLEELREAGAYIQINADTISGESGFWSEIIREKTDETGNHGFCRLRRAPAE